MTADHGRLDGKPRVIRQLAAAQLILPEAAAGDEDPTRRQLQERVLGEGIRLEAVVEVESQAAALTARGVGETVASAALISEFGLADRVSWVSLDPPLLEHYAIFTRRGAPSAPATCALVEIVSDWLSTAIEGGSQP